MASLTNVYRIIDDYAPGTNAVSTGGPGAGGTGQPLSPDFVAASAANALTVAYLFSSIFQRPVRLAPVGSSPPFTLVIGIAPTNGLTQVPSGVVF